MKPGLYDMNNNLLLSWQKMIDLDIIEIEKLDDNDISLISFSISFCDEHIRKESKNGYIVIDDSITIIEQDCFEWAKLDKIYINKNIYMINKYALDFASINEIHVDSENKHFSSENGVLYNKNKSILIKYPTGKKDKEFTIPSTVEMIGHSSFYKNYYIENVIANQDIIEIGEYAFYKTNLKNAIFNGKIKKISYCAFADCLKLKQIIFGKTIEIIENLILDHCSDSLHIKYGSTKEKFLKIKNISILLDELPIKNIEFQKTLEELINEGKSIREANAIIKKQQDVR